MSDPYLWWKHGVVYQIYPRSFADSNGDGIGDLKGIRSRLPYLAKLGIDAIWLSPINPSPDVDFGYDVSDYYGIDPRFGTMADFEALLEEAHALHIHVLLDMVLNHTSDQHEWFIQSRQSRENPFHEWYLWRDGIAGRPPNNWTSWFGGDGWEYDPGLDQYYFHLFYKQQPDLNWRHSAVRDEIKRVLDFWLKKGVDGFRLDVFNAYFKDAGLRSNPPRFGLRGFDRQIHINDFDQPEMFPLLNEFRQLTDRYDHRYMVGEPFISSPAKAAAYTSDELLHAAFNFRLIESPWKAPAFADAIATWEQAMSNGRWPTWVINNHDNKRSATRYVRGEDDAILKTVAMLLLTLRGTPYLYYGEEIGMRDIPIARHEIQDPIGKRYWPFYIGRDGCRSPMQWTAGQHAGFTTGSPWLPVHQNHALRNVETQQADDDSILNTYRRLLGLRRQHPSLHRGEFTLLYYDERSLAYLRTGEMEQSLIVLNFSSSPAEMPSSETTRESGWKLLYASSDPPMQSAWPIKLAGHEARIYNKTF